MTFRLLHLSNDLYPRVTGGTEIFVRQLIDAQLAQEPPVHLLWAAHEGPLPSRDHSPTAALSPEQRLLPPIKPGGRRDLAAATAAEISGFAELLAEFCPDVVHLHSWSDRCGLVHARAVKAFGARLVVTVHSPGVTCMKSTLIDAHGRVCDGVMRERRCTRCRLHSGGAPYPLAAAVALQHGWPLDAEATGILAHLLTWRQLTKAFQAAWHELVHLADAIHVLPEWSREVLLRNGAPPEKVHLIRTAGPKPLPPPQRRPMEDGVLRLVYWGRCNPEKGLHLVIEAIRRLPASAPIQLDFYGPYWDSDYGHDLLAHIAADSRFRLCGNVPKEQLLPRLQDYDLAVVPSIWLEAGPLTVLEAFAAGLPVAGSDLGGIKELLTGGAGHLLPTDPKDWQQFLQRSLINPEELKPPPEYFRDFSAVATELLPLYG